MDQNIFKDLLDDEINNFESKLDLDLGELLKNLKLSVAVAESITGGMLSQRITTLPGSSDYFLGGIISYHNKLKVGLLGVQADTLRSKSVVSEEVALEMARGLKKLVKSDICISTTGVAGPANQEFFGNIIGRVYLGFIIKDIERVKSFHFSGDRNSVRRQTTSAALNYLRQYLVNEKRRTA
ncbi:MAG: CinA family protein [Candidatus Margulisiibacteriota bacterium]|jgi:nicotinamide-nucleotide amidase